MKKLIRALTLLVTVLSLGIYFPLTIARANVTARADYDVNITSSFSPTEMGVSEISRLTLILVNPNAFLISSVNLTDNLPAGLEIAGTPSLTSNCGGTITADAGTTLIKLERGVIASSGSCMLQVNVAATTAGTLENQIAADSLTASGPSGQTVSNSAAASSTLQVGNYDYSAGVTASYYPAYIQTGQTSVLSVTVTNTNLFALSSVNWTADDLPSGLTIANPSNATVSGDCGSGVLTADADGTSISFSGGSVPAKTALGNGTCTITVDVKAGDSATGNLTTHIGASSFSASGNSHTIGTQTDATATLNVATLVFNAEVNKTFVPSIINPGGITSLQISIYNSNTFDLINAAWQDHLDSIQPGITIAPTPGVTNTCGGTVVANPGDTMISLSGGTVPKAVGEVKGSCTVTVNVTSTTQGNLDNMIPSGGLTASNVSGNTISNIDPTLRTLQVNTMVAPAITKSFNPNTVQVGETSTMTINIKNNDQNYILTGTSLVDVLPGNIVLADTVSESHNNCGSGVSITANPGDDQIIISNATIPANTVPATPALATCSVSVKVKSMTPGEYTNRIEAGAINDDQGVSNASPASADLNVQAIEIGKAFSPTTFQAGDTTLLTITLTNRANQKYTNIYLKDVLPAPLEVDADVTPATTCTETGNPATVDISGSPQRTIELNNGTMDAASDPGTPVTCTITVGVTAPSGSVRQDTSRTNTIAVNVLSANPTITNYETASASVTTTPITIEVGKSFSPNRFEAGKTSRLYLTLRNDTTQDFTGVGLVDVMPDHMTFSGSVGFSCTGSSNGGTASYQNPPDKTPAEITISGATLLSGTYCTYNVLVTTDAAITTQRFTNSIPQETVTSIEGVSNLVGTSAWVDLYTTGTGVQGSKSFDKESIPVGDAARLTINLSAPADQDLSNFHVRDTLPDGLAIYSTPNATFSSDCGTSPTTSITTGTDGSGKGYVELNGGVIGKGKTCQIRVNVTGTAPGTFTNTINPGDISNNLSQTLSAAITSTLRVTNMSMSKAFYPDKISPDGFSTLTITLENNSTSPLVDVNLTDALTTMGDANNYVIVAANPNKSTTCGSGSITAVAGSQSIQMTGGTVPARVGGVNGICTISVDVQGKRTTNEPPEITLTNTIPINNVNGKVGSSSGLQIKPDTDATANLTIKNLVLSVVKEFDPLTVFGGTLSKLSITLVNSNDVVLTGLAFDDNLISIKTGISVGNPMNISTGTCGGTLTATPGGTLLHYSGGTLAANSRCVISINATMNVNGNRTNTIPALGVTSFNGAKNTQPASATLTNLPGASVSKYFSPDTIVLGGSSTVTIEIKNTGNIPLTQIAVTDTLPSGLTIKDSPAPATTCKDASVGTTPTLTATAGTNVISLSNGSLPAGPNTTCTITVDVTSASAGVFTNTINKGDLTTFEGAKNTDPATDTLTVNASPDLQLVKTGVLDMTPVNPATSAEAGDVINYTIKATNLGDVTLNNVVITDSTVTLGTCSPTQPATLAQGESLTCQASYNLIQGDIDAGSFDNTAQVTSKLPNGDDGPAASDTESIPLNQTNVLAIKKVVSNNGPFRLGDTIAYNITATNRGTNTLNNVSISDATSGVTMGSCTPSQPAVLDPGETLVCAATHVVTYADIDLGHFSNTATADSDETSQVSDTLDVPVKQNTRLEIFKVAIPGGPYTTGSIITYNISAKNTGDRTLTGVQITDPGTDVTLGTCSPANDGTATLDPGEIMSCPASHTVADEDMTAGGFSNTAYADSNETDPVSDSATVILKTPTISLLKEGVLVDTSDSGHIDGRADAGETISYTFTVTNTGSVTLENVTLDDILGGVSISGGPIVSLGAGAVDNTTFTGTYTLTQQDIDNDTFANQAIVSGKPPVGSVVSAADDFEITLAEPGIKLEKSATPSYGADGIANVGETISYTFKVTNTGNTTLNDVTLTDAKISGRATITGGKTTLVPNEETEFYATYTLNQADLDESDGKLDNTASVTGTSPNNGDVSDTDTVSTDLPDDPKIQIVKTGTTSFTSGTSATYPDAGSDKINYSFVVTNTGTVTLHNVGVSDTGATGIKTSPGGATTTTLAPGASVTFTGSYTITQAAINSGTYTNTATASGTAPTGGSPVTATDDDTQTLPQNKAVTITKTGTVANGANGRADAGDKINYAFSVKNTGNVTLTNVRVTDANPLVTISGSPIASLAPGATNNSVTGSYTLTQADINAGTFTNTATATGTPPVSAGTDVTANDDDTRTLTAVKTIDLQKVGTIHLDTVAPAGVANPGDTITYTFTVTNTGNVTLTNISVTDAIAGMSINGSAITKLEPGEVDSTTYTGTYTLSQTDINAGTFTNTATVTGTPPSGSPITDTDPDTQNTLSLPSITLAKTGTLNPGSNGRVDKDDTITYTFVVTNTGNVPLSGVTITDPKVTVSGGPISLAIGASDSTSFTGTYTIKQSDIDSGTFTNTATVSGNPPTGSAVNNTDGDTQTLSPDPLLDFSKTGTLNSGSNGRPDAGDTVTYAFIVTNTGNVTLTNIRIGDKVGGVTITGSAITSLAPGQSNNSAYTGTYTLTQTDINAGTFTNTATATATTPHSGDISKDDSDTQTLTASRTIDLQKTGTLHTDVVTPNDEVNAGDSITYVFRIENTGNVTLTNVSLSDTMFSWGTTTIPTLLPGAVDTSTFTATHTLTQEEIDDGSFSNTATVTGTPPSGSDISDTDGDEQTLTPVKVIELQKTGTLHMDVVDPADEVNAGDKISYQFSVENKGNVTLTDVTVTDPIITVSGGPITLDPKQKDDSTFTGEYIITQPDVDAGTFTNTATVTANPPSGSEISDTDDDNQLLSDKPIIGVAKRIVGSPSEVTPGVWDVTFEILIRNYGNVTIDHLQATDNLDETFKVLTDDPPSTYSVRSLTSSDFTVNWPGFNGSSDANLFAPANTDQLEVGAQGKIKMVVRITPTNGTSFMNSVTANGQSVPTPDNKVSDVSQNGNNPDPDDDRNPDNNNEPTPLSFGPHLFDPPHGIKLLNEAGYPIFRWTLEWINDTNIVAVNARVTDPIPLGVEFIDDGIPNGTTLPVSAPVGSTTNGVVCSDSSTITTTTACYYESPTTDNPRGQIIWEGTLGPDLGVSDPAIAVNDVAITFSVTVGGNVGSVKNVASIAVDQDGDGDFTGTEAQASTATKVWDRDKGELPKTGFSPDEKITLPEQPEGYTYTQFSDFWLEIPSLNVRADIVGVPADGESWDTSWLGNKVGYLDGSVFPTWVGNSVITGHVWDAFNNPGVFAQLKTLKYGDIFKIHYQGEVYTYEVRESNLIAPTDVKEVMKHYKDYSWVTLLTCEEYANKDNLYEKRRMVRGVLISQEP